MPQYSNPVDEVTNYATDVFGWSKTKRSGDPEFRIGTVTHGKQGSKWVYVKASEAVTGTCTVNTTTFALTDIAGNYTAEAPFAANEYGWVRQTAVDLV